MKVKIWSPDKRHIIEKNIASLKSNIFTLPTKVDHIETTQY